MKEKFNTISFCTSSYSDVYERTIDEESLFRDIADFLRIAMKNNYQCKMWFDGTTYVIEFEKNEDLSGVSLEWVGEDEYVEKYGKAESDDISWKRIEEVAQDVMDDCGICY